MLPSPAMPPIPNGPLPLENALKAATRTPENGQFGAVLAHTQTTDAALLAGPPDAIAAALSAEAADISLPEGGKDLPEATETAADPSLAIALLTLLPQPASQNETSAAMQPVQSRPGNQPSVPALPATLPAATWAETAPPPVIGPDQVQSLAKAPMVDAPPIPLVAPPRKDGSRAASALVDTALRLSAEPSAEALGGKLTEVSFASLPSAGSAQPVAGLAAPFSSAPSPSQYSLPPLSQGPLDFAALIDRLAVAREQAQPQAATVALAHAEFGQVELRFASDGTGLSVAMTSADPDFARAVQAAVPAVSATGESGSTQGRQPGHYGAGDSSAGQQHGQPARQHAWQFRAPDRAEPSRSDAGRHSGIFA